MMVKRWQKDANGFLIFVRLCVCIHFFFSHMPEYHRPVYSPLRSLLSLLLLSKT